MKHRFSIFIASLTLLTLGCGSTPEVEQPTVAPVSLKDVPSLRLNYKYEGDVPSPKGREEAVVVENDAAVLADFTSKRVDDTLIRTMKSPDKQRTVAVYRKGDDVVGSFRLDIYDADGRFLRKASPDQMSVSFPEAIRWSPDSQSFVFLGVLRETTPSLSVFPKNTDTPATAKKSETAEKPKAEGSPSPSPVASPTPSLEPAVLTLRTRDVSGISRGMYSAFTLGVARWLAYGLVLRAWPIVVANALTVALAATILSTKIVVEHQRRRGGEGQKR